MSYKTKLIGIIDIEEENLTPIVISSSHFSDLEKLAADYGLLGKGFRIIIENPIISSMLSSNGVSNLVVSRNAVDGLKSLAEPKRNLVAHLLKDQYERSERIFTVAKKTELEEYDNVSIGVIKGVLLGGAVGVLLDTFVGTTTIETEVLSRAGPGLLEASAISHEVEEGTQTVPGKLERLLLPIKRFGEGKNNSVKILANSAYYSTKIPLELILVDIPNIVKRLPSGMYKGINIFGWIDKIKGRSIRDDFETNTQRWAEAQESAPYRGLVFLEAIRRADQAIKPYVESSPPFTQNLYKVVYNAFKALINFWINTGNNVQGIYAVVNSNEEGRFRDYLHNLNIRGWASDRWRAVKITMDDPFQLSQTFICTLFYTFAAYLQFAGLEPEKLELFGTKLGNTGPALQSMFQSTDTAFSAQIAKLIAYSKLLIPAKYSVSIYNLMKLAHEYGDHELMEKLRRQPSEREMYLPQALPTDSWNNAFTKNLYNAWARIVELPLERRLNDMAYNLAFKSKGNST